MTILSVRHVTKYRYDRPVKLGEHRLMFRPRDSFDQRLIDASVSIDPQPCDLHWLLDPFGNCVTVVDFDAATDCLGFESVVTLDHFPSNAPDFRLDASAALYPFVYSADELPDLASSIRRAYSDPDRRLDQWARSSSGRTARRRPANC